MKLMTVLTEKAGTFGALISAAACPACFPALAGLGAALGLGALAQYEAVFVTRLLPLFAFAALLANGLAWFNHRRWRRGAVGLAGPAIVLASTALLLLGKPLAQPLLYAGLALMVSSSLWDLVARARSRGACGPAGCERT